MASHNITRFTVERFQEHTAGKKVVLLYPRTRYRHVFLARFLLWLLPLIRCPQCRQHSAGPAASDLAQIPCAVAAICGIPQILYVHNGSDFTSTHLEQACIHLKIQLIHSPPGQPRGRGKVERFFRTINQTFLIELPGYRHQGQFITRPTLDLDSLAAHFESFLHEQYHQQPHSTTRQSPVQRWQGQGFLLHCPAPDTSLISYCCGSDKHGRFNGMGCAFKGCATLNRHWPPLWVRWSKFVMTRAI